MRALFVLLATCVAGVAAAEGTAPDIATEPVPLVVRGDVGMRDPRTGLIGMWADNAVNKQSARKVERFTQALAAPDFPALLRAAFGCFATRKSCANGQAFVEQHAFEDAVRASPAQYGYVVELSPELVTGQLLIRATAHRMQLANDSARTLLRVEPSYTALYYHQGEGRFAVDLEDLDTRDPRTH